MKKEQMVCENPCCGEWHGYYKHGALRILLALILLGFVFHMGVKFGEFKAMFNSSYGFDGHRMMGDKMLFMHRGMMPGEVFEKRILVPPTPPATTTEAEEE